MSQALRTAIVARLTDGVQGISLGLDKLVARDPNDNVSPAIVNGRKSQVEALYPCLTYRLTGDVPDIRFRGPAGSGMTGRIYNIVLEIEYWTRVADSAPIDRVRARLLALLDNPAAFPIPSVTIPSDTEGEDDETDAGGRVVECVCATAQIDHRDEKNECWFGLFRFHLRYQLA